MKYTNRLNLPQPIVDAVVNDGYDKGPAHISITGLLAPPRIRVLKKIHEDELTEDVSERIWSLLGQVMHGILERANKSGLAEQRFYFDVNGITISGQADAFYEAESGLLQDYKLTSLYQIKDGVKPEFVQQLNCYAYLFRHGYTVAPDGTKILSDYRDCPINRLEDVCILRDWSKGKAERDSELPQEQIVTVRVPKWTDEETLAFITERVRIHKSANKKLPLCTDHERWATPDKWAVMPKKGADRSLKNHISIEDAESHAAGVPGSFVEFRPGENKRCDAWCPVSQFCTQYKNLKKERYK